MHPVLDGEKRDGCWFPSGNLLHQRLREAGLGRFRAFNRRGKLLVVSGEDNPVCFLYRNPRRSLQGLRGLVDEERREVMRLEESVGGSDERTSDDARLLEQFPVYLHREPRLAVSEAGKPVAVGLPLAPASVFEVILDVADGFPYAPEFGVIGVGFEATFIGK